MTDQPENVFAEEIQIMIEQLSSNNAAERREAAYFLGEAAAADAVPDLIDVYQNDTDASVREAAAYSLGMFKAIDRSLAKGKNGEKQVTRLLRQIEERGELGNRARTGRTIRLVIGLTLTLVVLLIAYFGFRVKLKVALFGSTHSHSAVVADLQQTFNLVNNDARTLQNTLISVISNQPLSCTAFFNNPAPYRVDPVDAQAFPDLAAIGSRLNAIQSSLAAAKARYDAACSGGAAFGVTEAHDAFALLTPALQGLVPLQADLAQAGGGQPATAPAQAAPPAAQPTVAPANTIAAPTPQPSPTPVVAANPKTHLPELYNLLDDVTSPRGASTLLLQYWRDVQNTGTTTGCTVTSLPTIPDSISVPEADLQASPNLREAVQLTNNGIAALRDGWQRFQSACSRGDLASVAQTELAGASVVANSFDAAKVLLDRIQSGG